MSTVACDVAREDDTVAATKATVDRFGRIDSCFANAGFGHGADPLKLEMEDWRRLMSVNLDGVFLSFRETAKHMVERGGGGKLVAISSITEIFGAPIRPTHTAWRAVPDPARSQRRNAQQPPRNRSTYDRRPHEKWRTPALCGRRWGPSRPPHALSGLHLPHNPGWIKRHIFEIGLSNALIERAPPPRSLFGVDGKGNVKGGKR